MTCRVYLGLVVAPGGAIIMVHRSQSFARLLHSPIDLPDSEVLITRDQITETINDHQSPEGIQREDGVRA